MRPPIFLAGATYLSAKRAPTAPRAHSLVGASLNTIIENASLAFPLRMNTRHSRAFARTACTGDRSSGVAQYEPSTHAELSASTVTVLLERTRPDVPCGRGANITPHAWRRASSTELTVAPASA